MAYRRVPGPAVVGRSVTGLVTHQYLKNVTSYIANDLHMDISIEGTWMLRLYDDNHVFNRHKTMQKKNVPSLVENMKAQGSVTH